MNIDQLQRMRELRSALWLTGFWPDPDQELPFEPPVLRENVADAVNGITDVRLLHVGMWVCAMLFAMEQHGFDVTGGLPK